MVPTFASENKPLWILITLISFISAMLSQVNDVYDMSSSQLTLLLDIGFNSSLNCHQYFGHHINATLNAIDDIYNQAFLDFVIIDDMHVLINPSNTYPINVNCSQETGHHTLVFTTISVDSFHDPSTNINIETFGAFYVFAIQSLNKYFNETNPTITFLERFVKPTISSTDSDEPTTSYLFSFSSTSNIDKQINEMDNILSSQYGCHLVIAVMFLLIVSILICWCIYHKRKKWNLPADNDNLPSHDHDSKYMQIRQNENDNMNADIESADDRKSNVPKLQNALIDEIMYIENGSDSIDGNIFDIPLIQEIIRNENEYRKHIKAHPSRHNNSSNKNNQKRGRNNENRDNSNNNNNNDDNDKEKHYDDNNDNNNDKDDDKDDEKKNNNDDNIYGEKDIAEILCKVEILKKHFKYKQMAEEGKQLLETELIALVYYTDSSSCCHKMKESHRGLLQANIRKYKELYFHVTNGVGNMYQVFHYKVENQLKIPRLYHGSTIKSLDALSQEQLFLKTVFSFSTKFGVAASFATGCILIIDEAYSAIYSGKLKGADVTWISKWDEAEYIILPTTFYQWRQIQEQEIEQNKWIVGSHINIYITKDCISNDNALSIHPDRILPKMSQNYNEFMNNTDDDNEMYDGLNDEYNAIKDWFLKDVSLPKREDNIKYFELFIENGYEAFDLIMLIKNEQRLKEIGIVKIGHILKILDAIEKLRDVDTPSTSVTIGINDDFSETI